MEPALMIATGMLGGKTKDTTAPTVTITCAQTGPTAVSPLNAIFTLSEVATDFDLTKITVGKATKGNFAGSGKNYTCDITPDGTGAPTVDVAAGAFHDGAGNASLAAAQFSIAILGAEQIVYGGMETGNPPDGWFAWPDAGTTISSVADPRPGSAGAKALRLTLLATPAGTNYWVTLTAGKTYLMEYYLKGVTDPVDVQMDVFDTSWNNIFLRNFTIGTSYEKKSFVMPIIAATNYILIQATGPDGKNLDLDEVSVREIFNP